MPFLTVSRMYGSGGSMIAARAARDLGWTLFDNAVVDAVVERSGLTRAEVSAKDERVPSLVERLAAAISFATPESMPAVAEHAATTTEEEVVRATRRVIEEAVQAGPAVFVGRGAQCLLAQRGDALHVFCYADPDVLVRNAIALHGVPSADAERVVAETNKQREHYVRRHWHRDWKSPANYHLCVNTGVFGMDASAEMIVGAVRMRFG
jgi:cytidylate kinase